MSKLIKEQAEGMFRRYPTLQEIIWNRREGKAKVLRGKPKDFHKMSQKDREENARGSSSLPGFSVLRIDLERFSRLCTEDEELYWISYSRPESRDE